jgi:hypothetical protein
VSKFGLISSAFVLNWTPEQAEDLYTVLVNGSKVAWLEVLRESNELVDFQIASVEKYERSLRSQQERIKLAVALDLAIKELDEILSGKLLQKKAEKEKGELPTP